jgi:probable phosphoglycerate mutase
VTDHSSLSASVDGGARGNPGKAGYGAHVTGPSGEMVAEVYGYLGIATNNVAEYAALLAALEFARSAGASALSVRSDSQLMVRQIQGRYKVKNAGLQPLFRRARQLIGCLERFHIEHVRREENQEADALANRAMDEEGDSGHFTREQILGGKETLF